MTVQTISDKKIILQPTLQRTEKNLKLQFRKFKQRKEEGSKEEHILTNWYQIGYRI